MVFVTTSEILLSIKTQSVPTPSTEQGLVGMSTVLLRRHRYHSVILDQLERYSEIQVWEGEKTASGPILFGASDPPGHLIRQEIHGSGQSIGRIVTGATRADVVLPGVPVADAGPAM